MTWVELVIDFELATGIRCASDFTESPTWSARAKMLKYIVKKLLEVRSLQAGDLKLWYGDHQPGVASLASFGLKLAAGLRRRPRFVHPQTLRCVGKNAYSAAEESTTCPAKETDFGKLVPTFTGFRTEPTRRGCKAEEELEKAAGLVTKPTRRLYSKTPSSAFVLP